MAQKVIRQGEDGNYYYLNNLQWLPLEHGKTSFVNDKGDTVLWDETKLGFTRQATMGDYTRMGMASSYDAVVRAGEQLGMYDEAEAQRRMQDNPVGMPNVMPSPDTTATYEAWDKGVVPGLIESVKNPVDFAGPALAQSIPSMAVPLATGMIGAAVGGLPGMVIGGVAGGVAVNQPTKYNEVLNQLASAQGIDPASDQFAVFASNPSVKAEAQQQANLYAAAMAPFDALGMGLGARTAGRMMATQAARKTGLESAVASRSIPGTIAAGTAQQMGTGLAGEASAQTAQTGGIYDPASVALEGILEVPGMVGDIATGVVAHRNTPQAQPAPAPTENVTPSGPDFTNVDPELQPSTPQLSPPEQLLALPPPKTPSLPQQSVGATLGGAYSQPSGSFSSFTPQGAQSKGRVKKAMPKLSKKEQQFLNDLRLEGAASARQVNPLTQPKDTLYVSPKGEVSKDNTKTGILEESPFTPNQLSKSLRDSLKDLPLPKDVKDQVVLKGIKDELHNYNVGLAELVKTTSALPEFMSKRPTEQKSELQRLKREYDSSYRVQPLNIPSLVEDAPQLAEKITKALPKGFKLSLWDKPKEQTQVTPQEEPIQLPNEKMGPAPWQEALAKQITPVEVKPKQDFTQMEKDVFEEDLANLRADPMYKLGDAQTKANLEKELYLKSDPVRKIPNAFSKKYSSSTLVDFPTRGNAALARQNQLLQEAGMTPDSNLMFKNYQENLKNQKTRRMMDGLLRYETDTILRGVLKRVGILDYVDPVVSLDTLAQNAGGFVEGKTICIAAVQPEGRDVFNTINHEVIHALRNLGLFSQAEWRALEGAAEREGWVSKYGFDTNPEYEGLSETELLEETVAEHFAQTRNTPKPVMGRIQKFFQALKGFLSDVLGITTPDQVSDIFGRIESGELVSKRTPVDKAFQRETGVKYWRQYRKEVKDVKESLRALNPNVAPRDFKEDLQGTIRSIGFMGRWFRDMQTHATRIPVLRPLYTLTKGIEQTAHEIRTSTINKLVPMLRWSKEERKVFNTAAAYLAANEEPLPFTSPSDKDITVTLKVPFAGLGSQVGDSVTITPKMQQQLLELDMEFRYIRNKHGLSTIMDMVVSTLKEASAPKPVFTALDTALSLANPEKFNETVSGVLTKFTPEKTELIKDVEKLTEELSGNSKNFYIPRVRQTPYFFTVYDRSKPLPTDEKKLGGRIKTTVVEDEPYKRIATINIPTSFFGNQIDSKKALEFMEKRLEEIRKVYPDAYTPIEKDNYGIVNLDGIHSVDQLTHHITSSQLTLFEQLASVQEIPGLDEKGKEALFKSIRQAWSARGFETFEKKALGLQGYIHGDNVQDYIIGAGAVYANKAATSISRNLYSRQVNEARSNLSKMVVTGVLDKSVKDFADDYVEYIYSNLNEYGQLRGWMFNYYLGLNVSSAFLNTFQIYHSSLPVLTKMGFPAHKAIAVLTKNALQQFTKTKGYINWKEPANPNPYVFSDQLLGASGETGAKARLVEALTNKGVLRPTTVEEMQARDVALQLEGDKRDIESFTDFCNKTNNVFSFLFNRIEATTRVATAVSAYELLQDKLKQPNGMADILSKLQDTPFSEVVTKDNIHQYLPEIAVELSHPNTTKYNRAKAFRGALSVPTQFMSFPVKMLDLYLNILGDAIGFQMVNGKPTFSGDKDAAKAFAVLFLGLMVTSGLSGAIPFGEPMKDLYDKTYKMITGIDPDIETELRSMVVDATGSPVFAEMLDKGLLRSLTGVDVSGRMGVQMFSGVNTEQSLFSLLGPAGSTVGLLQEAFERYEQGHTTLAIAAIAPSAIRNPLKALYENEYGVVTKQGNIVPTDYGFMDTLFQSTGFAPTEVARAREEQYASDRLGRRTSVAKERAYDALVTLRVKSILARRRGDTEEAEEALQEYREYLSDLQQQNSSADPRDYVKIDQATVTRRTLEQVKSATTGEIRRKQASEGISRAQDNLQGIYPR